MRKVAFVAIPVLVSKDVLVQSVSMFVCLIMYTFSVLKLQPMANSTLNQIEILSCIGIIVGCFSSIFFAVEYKGSLVLSGASRELAGLLLVVVCSTCVLLSLRSMWNEFSSRSSQMHSAVHE
jgi:preprotein translocase subunit SecF